MTVSITPTHNDYRLAGTLAHLDAGPGPATVRIYEGTRPAQATDVPSGAMLVQIPLTKPAGEVGGGLLTLTQAEDGLIAHTGIATWARFVNGHAETCFDVDAGEGEGPWELQLVQVQMYAGGAARIMSAVLG